MALNLDPERKRKLVEALTPVLDGALVSNRMFLEHSIRKPLQELDGIAPKSGPRRDSLRRYIGDEPVSDFIYGEISKELVDLADYKSGAVGRLVEMAGYEDAAATSQRLIDALDALPRRYACTLPLPAGFVDLFQEGETSVQVAEGIRIVRGDELRGSFELPKQPGLVGMFVNKDWDIDSAYLQVDFAGYVGKFVTTESHEDAVEVLFAFLGALLATACLEVERGYELPSSFAWNRDVHEWVNGAWKFLETSTPEGQRNNLLARLKISDRIRAELRHQYLRLEVARVAHLFNAPSAARLRLQLGCRWLFDSYIDGDQLLQYIRATVVVETLLGDKAASDQVGLGKLLGNRCAYFIGHTHTQRGELLDDFSRIYDIRSKIVHSGKSRLSRAELDSFYTLHWICGRIIQREIELLQRERR